MNYENKELNIVIQNSDYFDEIKETEFYVQLLSNGVEKYLVFSNSTVVAHDNSTVRAYGNSTVEACEFSCVRIKSTNANILTKNHFGAIIKQVFKTSKKTIVYKKLDNNRIAVLELEKGQVFQSENHDKCRTDKAKVLRIESIDGNTQYQDGISQYDDKFKYVVGEIVSSEYDEKIKECSTGIHFFLTREKAERY